ncbi:MAG TPA: twin-arginine translocase subunit TatC [Gammaproteobacteria bacterium]|nr:twin-arginine translocase subunit TatC [Gammaproteobacteria bacterium]
MDSYIPHLIECRTRIIRSGLIILCLFSALFCIDEHLYTWVAKPLLSQLPAGTSIIATAVTTPFMVPMKLALLLAFFMSIPYLLYEIWSFIAPGLYLKERKRVLPFLVASTILFYGGVVFAYYIICPMALGFFAKCAPVGVLVMTDIQSYLDFVLSILFASGIAFQVPIITWVLLQSGLVTISQMEHYRPFVIVATFVIGMILTPPDVVSQILLALPMWWLFEAGLLLAKFLNKKSTFLATR